MRCVAPAFSLLVSIVVLTGCASDGGLKPKSALANGTELASKAAIAGATVSPAAWPAEDWYARYGDMQLSSLIDEAMTANPGLRVAEARVRQAAAAGAIAESNLSPQISAGARTSRQLFSANSTVPKPLAGNWAWNNDASINLSYELDFWGKNQSNLAAAVGRQRATEVEAQASRLMLAVAITQSYLRLSQTYAQLDLAESVVLQREHLRRLTEERVRAQLDSIVDLKQAELAVPIAQEQVAATRESVKLLQFQIAALVGAGPDRGLKISRPALHMTGVPTIPSALSSELISRRPDIVAQRWRVEAAAQYIKVAKAQFLPSFNLGALVGLQSLGFDRLLTAGSRVSGASSALSLPIFDGGRLRGALAARDAEYDAAVEQYNMTLVEAVRDVVSQLASIKALEERSTLQAAALKSAQQAYELSQQRYRAGIGNYLQVLSTQIQVLTLERASIEFDTRAIDLDINLVRALGGGYQVAAAPSLNNPQSVR